MEGVVDGSLEEVDADIITGEDPGRGLGLLEGVVDSIAVVKFSEGNE